MATDLALPLMDDVEFLAELEKFDRLPPRPMRVRRAEEPREVSGQAWAARPIFEDSEAESPLPPASESSAGRIALGVAGFLLMVCVGGAAAVLVFQDRVAILLH